MNDTITTEPSALAIIPAPSLPTLIAADENDILGKLRAELAGYTPITPEPPAQISGAVRVGTITYYPEMEQGSVEWLQIRCGLLTASETKLIVTPTLKIADNDKTRAHLWDLLAQRVTKFVEPQYVSDDMLRGKEDEVYARILYAERFAPVTEMGFITNDRWGFTLGYSPDGLVGDDGAIECKSRRAKYQVQTIVENIGIDKSTTIPVDYLMQHQSGLLTSERQWIDFISYSGGLPMAKIRVWPDAKVQNAIVEAAGEFERKLAERLAIYHEASQGLIPTERRVEQEMYI